MKVVRPFECFFPVVLSFLLACGAGVSAAQEEQNSPEQEAADPAASASGEEQDVYAVPEGSPQELLDFAQKLLSTPPEDRSPEGLEAHREKLIAAAVEATSQVLASEEATGQQAARAAEIKLQMLSFLAQTGGEDGEQKLEEFQQQIRDDERPAVRAVVIQRDLLEKVGNWRQLDGAAREEWRNDVVEYLGSVDLDRQHGQLVAYLVRMLGQQDDKEAAAELVSLVKPVFESSDNEQVAAVAERLEGAVRYMNLEGSTMEIEGRRLSGEPFDWSQHKGQVVLVDFWATWCGPCIAELPNVIENYEEYHDKGFEVIGISLDTDAGAVREFVEKRDIPWPILFSDDPDATGWEHPMAVKYGVQAIPAAILVNQEGKVVTTSARGAALGRHLEELLGQPLTSEGEDAEAEPAGESTGG